MDELVLTVAKFATVAACTNSPDSWQMGRSCRTCISLEHILFSQAVLADLGLVLGITIFSKSTTHGHFQSSHQTYSANSTTLTPHPASCPVSMADPHLTPLKSLCINSRLFIGILLKHVQIDHIRRASNFLF